MARLSELKEEIEGIEHTLNQPVKPLAYEGGGEVRFENDANCLALSEAVDGAGLQFLDEDIRVAIGIAIHQVGGVTLKGHKTSIATECWLIAASAGGYP